MDKSPEAFRTISEVAETLDTPAHVLRFWETRFPQVKPVKRAGGRRYYRPSDVALLSGIKRLLHDEGLTIRGVQKILREQGIRHVAALGSGQAPTPEDEAETIEAQLTAALGTTDADTLPAAEAETAQVIALETVLSRADRSTPPVQRDLWEAEPAMPDDDDVAEAPMIEMVEPEPPAPVTVLEPASASEQAPDSVVPAPDPAATDTMAGEAADQIAGSGPDAVLTEAETQPVESDQADDTPTPAARLRALPRGALARQADAVGEIQDRILTLRAKLVEATGRRHR